MIFYIFSCILDEISTLNYLKKGGIETNPIVAWMIGISYLVWILYDVIMFLVTYAYNFYMRDKLNPKIFTAFWIIFGALRLYAAIHNIQGARNL
ncbi:unnamed protein product [marine sediment metagenome]|uniref:DUF5658 domain-containing protein n=1 Tax=marine sediment metagenome TaxID=412755 RepID=X0YCP9_9ZZZZ